MTRSKGGISNQGFRRDMAPESIDRAPWELYAGRFQLRYSGYPQDVTTAAHYFDMEIPPSAANRRLSFCRSADIPEIWLRPVQLMTTSQRERRRVCAKCYQLHGRELLGEPPYGRFGQMPKFH